MKPGEAKKPEVLTPSLTSVTDAPFDLDFKFGFVTYQFCYLEQAISSLFHGTIMSIVSTMKKR